VNLVLNKEIIYDEEANPTKQFTEESSTKIKQAPM